MTPSRPRPSAGARPDAPPEAERTRTARGWPDLQLALLVCIAAVLLYVGAAALPPPLFDPLGSAAVPKATALILVTFAIWMAIPALRLAERPAAAGPLAAVRGGAMVLLAFGYAYALDLRIVPFWVATLLFVPLAAMIITPRRTVLTVAVAIGLVLGVGGQALFTRVFYIDLPV